MKMFNKKGKLFGLINIIDLLIIVVVILVGVFVVGKLTKDDISVASSNKTEIFIVAEAYKKSADVVDGFVVGDRIFSQNKYQEGTIEYVNIKDADEVVTMANGDLVLAKNPALKDVEVGIKCSANVSGPYIDVGGQEIKVGLTYYIKTDKAEVLGTIKEIRFE